MSEAPAEDHISRTQLFLAELDAAGGIRPVGDDPVDLDDDDEPLDGNLEDAVLQDFPDSGSPTIEQAPVVDVDDDATEDREHGAVLAAAQPATDTMDFIIETGDPLPPAAEVPATADPPRFSRPAVIGFVAATAVTAIAVAAAMIALRPGQQVIADPDPDTVPQVAVIAAPTPSGPPAPAPGGDAPIPYTASAQCAPGSTPAQAVDGSTPTQAWVCVRDGADGQVLTLDLGRPMVITAISIVPGWVGTDASGADQWLAHRVVKRVQWILANGEHKLPVAHDTGGARGPAVKQMPASGPEHGVLASRIQMIVQETARPPAQPAPSPDSAGPGGLLTDVLGAPLGSAPAALPVGPDLGGADSPTAVDNTFAVSAITVLGHAPQ